VGVVVGPKKWTVEEDQHPIRAWINIGHERHGRGSSKEI